MRKTIKHKVYTIEEKNEIVRKYIEGELGLAKLLQQYDIGSDSVFYRWHRQFQKHGTCVDGRGKPGDNRKGRPRNIRPQEMTREELIQYVEAVEDVKKYLAYLRKQKKNIE
jgi:transposase-like protein